MVKKDYDSISETGNWNVASDYSRIKIMKPLMFADEYETIAVFGTSSLFEEIQANYNVDFLKIKAFKRLIHTLVLLIDNSYFALKSKTDKEAMSKLRKTLKRVEKIIPTLFEVKTLNSLNCLNIYEKRFVNFFVCSWDFCCLIFICKNNSQ